MGLLEHQKYISRKRGMPTDDLGQSSAIISITGETIQLYTVAANGTASVDVGSAAGTLVVAKFAYDNIMNQLGDQEGQKGDTSVSFTSTALTSEKWINGALEDVAYNSLYDRVVALTAGMSNGDYSIDYTTGMIYGVKADTSSTLTATSYKIAQSVVGGSSGVADSIDLIKVGGTAVKTGGTAGLLGVGITDGTNSVDISTSGSDGTTNVSNRLAVSSHMKGFNGSTWDRLRTAVVTAGQAVTGWLNVITTVVYNPTKPTLTTGQFSVPQCNVNGAMDINEVLVAQAEDNTNGVFAICQKALPISTYALTKFKDLGSNATANVKNATGNLFSVYCHNLNAAVRYIQIHNTATTPGGGATPTYSFLVPAGGTVFIDSSFFGPNGVNFTTGIAFGFSTTETTYTGGTSTDQVTFIQYI